MRALLARLRDSFRRREIARVFEEEMEFHVAELKSEYQRRGLSEEAAANAARREFGNMMRTREQLHEQAGFPWWDEIMSDLAFAWRGLSRRPAFSLSVIVVLALGLAAAATIYSVIEAVVFRPLPVLRPDELHAITGPDRQARRVGRNTVARLESSLPTSAVAAYSGLGRATVQIDANPAVRASMRLVNGSFFRALGIAPAAGRVFEPADDVLDPSAHVVVVSSRWAKANFGSAESAVGAELVVNRAPVRVVGVLPEEFRDVVIGQRADLWFPTALQPTLRYSGNAHAISTTERPNDPNWNRDERIAWLEVLVRVADSSIRPVAALERAFRPEAEEIARALEDPKERQNWERLRLQLEPAPGGHSSFRTSFLATGALLASVVGVMLILTWTNVSGLLLVRSMSRHRELGVRLALGAGRVRVARLAFVEALLLSSAGSIAGVLLASWLLPLAATWLSPTQALPIRIDAQTVVIVIALGVLTAITSALAPALWISRLQPLVAFSSTAIRRAPIRVGRLLVIAQLAMAVALVAVAHSLGAELQRTLAADPGFARQHVLTATFDASTAGYDAKTRPLLFDRVRTVASRVAGVSKVALAESGILAGSQTRSAIYFRASDARVSQGHYQRDSIDPDYFTVVGTPLLRGRPFAPSDGANSTHVAIVSAALAREVYGDRDPIGERFGFGPTPAPEDWTIVGVVADVRSNGMRTASPAMFYLPAAQFGDDLRFLAVQSDAPVATVRRALREAFAAAEPGLVFSNWRTLEERIVDDVSSHRTTTMIATAFAASALVLAATGVAASLGYLVVLRQRELALRMALGASPRQLLAAVLRDAGRLALLGSVAGLLIVWLISSQPVLATLVRPGFAPALTAAVVAVLAAILAGWVPARRAARVDPNLMLKAE